MGAVTVAFGSVLRSLQSQGERTRHPAGRDPACEPCQSSGRTQVSVYDGHWAGTGSGRALRLAAKLFRSWCGPVGGPVGRGWTVMRRAKPPLSLSSCVMEVTVSGCRLGARPVVRAGTAGAGRTRFVEKALRTPTSAQGRFGCELHQHVCGYI